MCFHTSALIRKKCECFVWKNKLASQRNVLDNFGKAKWESWFEGLHPKRKESYCGHAITFQLEEIKLCIFKICRASNLPLILNFESMRFNISPAIIGRNQCCMALQKNGSSWNKELKAIIQGWNKRSMFCKVFVKGKDIAAQPTPWRSFPSIFSVRFWWLTKMGSKDLAKKRMGNTAECSRMSPVGTALVGVFASLFFQTGNPEFMLINYGTCIS